nr:MAG TPA: hypothetical protein [Caudoviricetes sp.]
MNQEIKADAGKAQVSLVPMQIVRDIAAVREYGINKYGDSESWKEVECQRYIDALGRHCLDFLNNPFGLDEESGLPHLWHIECNAAFLSELMKGLFFGGKR